MAKSRIPSEQKSFEENLERLEEIVEELEGGDLPLEKALALFEEGVALGKTCSATLEEAERKITVLLQKTGGEVEEADLDAESAGPPEETGPAPRRAPASARRSPPARLPPPTPDDDAIPF